MLYYVAGVLTALLPLALYIIHRGLLPKPISGIPYNPEATGSIFGDFPSFKKWHAQRPELYNWIVAQSVKLNSPVIQIFMRPFSKPWVVVADFYEAEDIMARRTKEFGRADMFGDLFAPLLPNSHIHLPMGDEWRAHRRLIGDIVSQDFLSKVAGPQIYKRAVDVVQLWGEKARLAKGRPFVVLEDVTYSALEVMWSVAFGNEVGAVTSQIDALSSIASMEDIDSSFHDIDSPVQFPHTSTPAGFNAVVKLTTSVEVALNSPFPRPTYTFALKAFPSLRWAMREKNRMIKERLDEAWHKFSKTENDQNVVRSAAELIVQREMAMAAKEGREPAYDTPVIRDELFGLLIAGLDTTSISVCWGLKLLTAHQNVQEKLRSELRLQFGAAAAEGRLPTEKELGNVNIPYLEACIEEMHRLGGTASIGTRVALCDTEILGHHIPKGTDVFMLSQGPSYVLPAIAVDDKKRTQSSMEHKKAYGAWDDATIGEFIPERWLAADKDGELRFNHYAGPAHPFGAGPRGCFGRKFASLELKIIMTLIVWSYALQPLPSNLSTFSARDLMVHTPEQCYLRLKKLGN